MNEPAHLSRRPYLAEWSDAMILAPIKKDRAARADIETEAERRGLLGSFGNVFGEDS